jgi:hypothetical protein
MNIDDDPTIIGPEDETWGPLTGPPTWTNTVQTLKITGGPGDVRHDALNLLRLALKRIGEEEAAKVLPQRISPDWKPDLDRPPSRMLRTAFNWARSPEDWSHWQRVFEKLKDTEC